MCKKISRLRRAKRLRAHLRRLNVVRLCVHRSLKHIYAQVLEPCTARVIASASTLDAEVKKRIQGASGGKKKAAEVVGEMVAVRSLALGAQKVCFDRSGFRYHGRIRALADAARSAGLKF